MRYKIPFFISFAVNIIFAILFCTKPCSESAVIQEKALPQQINAAAEEICLAPEEPVQSVETCEPHTKPDTAEKDKNTVEGKMLPGKGIEQSLMAIEGMTLVKTLEIMNAIRDHVDFASFSVGETLKLRLSADGKSVDEFIYSPDIARTHFLKRDQNGKLVYSEEKKETEKRLRVIGGTFGKSVKKLLSEEKIVPEIKRAAYQFIEALPHYNKPAEKGSSFTVVLQDEYYQNEKLPRSKVLYISFDSAATGNVEGFYHLDPDEKSAFNAFYDATGKSYGKSGFRTPVDRVSLSSLYGMRIHPVTGRRQKHEGLDYTGKIGDPVYAVTDGTIARTGDNRLNGNFMFIEHAKGRESVYLHLDKILVKDGDHVKPGQKVALLGNSGRSTGPHLHFGWKEPGRGYIDPFKLRMSACEKLEGERLDAFKKEVENIRTFLKKESAAAGL